MGEVYVKASGAGVDPGGGAGTLANPFNGIAAALTFVCARTGADTVYLLGGDVHRHNTPKLWKKPGASPDPVDVRPAPGLSSADVAQWSYSKATGSATTVDGGLENFTFRDLLFSGGVLIPHASTTVIPNHTSKNVFFYTCVFRGKFEFHRFNTVEEHVCRHENFNGDVMFLYECGSPWDVNKGHVRNFKSHNCFATGVGTPTSGADRADVWVVGRPSGTWEIVNFVSENSDTGAAHSDWMELYGPIGPPGDCTVLLDSCQIRNTNGRIVLTYRDDIVNSTSIPAEGIITMRNCDFRSTGNGPCVSQVGHPGTRYIANTLITTGSQPSIRIQPFHHVPATNNIVLGNILDGFETANSPNGEGQTVSFVSGSSGYNLISSRTASKLTDGTPTASPPPAFTGDILSSNYGFETTPNSTQELAGSSPALNAGVPTSDATRWPLMPPRDRLNRNRNGRPDIGAYERGGVVQGGGDTSGPTTPVIGTPTVSGPTATITVTTPSTDPSGIARYELLRDGIPVKSFTTLTVTDAPGVGTFAYTVRAYDTVGNPSALSNSQNATVAVADSAAPTPNPPTGLAVQTNRSLAQLTWNALSDASGVGGVDILRATAAGGPYSRVGTAVGAATRYTDEPGVAGTFYYKIQAFDSVDPPNVGTASASASGTVTAPTASRLRPYVLTANPVLYMRLNEAASAANAIDRINPPTGGAYTNLAAGAYEANGLIANEALAKSVRLDGTNDHVRIAHHAKLLGDGLSFAYGIFLAPDVLAGGGTTNPINYVRGYTKTNGNSATSIAITGVDATASNSFLVVAVDFRGSSEPGGAVTGVTHGATALAFIGEGHRVDGTDVRRVELWGKAGLTGSATVTATLQSGETYNSQAMGVRVYSGVHQTLPLGTPASTGSSSVGPATITVTSASGEKVVDAAVCRGDRTLSVGAGQTERQNISTGTGTPHVKLGTSDEPGAASVVMSWALSGTAPWGIVAVALKPSSTAGGSSQAGIAVAPGRQRLWRDGADVKWSVTLGGVETTMTVADQLAIDTPVFLMAVRDGDQLRVYKNAVSVGTPVAISATTPIDTNSNDTLVGVMTTTPTLPFAGRMSDIMIFTRVPTASEIQAIYNAAIASGAKRRLIVT